MKEFNNFLNIVACVAWEWHNKALIAITAGVLQHKRTKIAALLIEKAAESHAHSAVAFARYQGTAYPWQEYFANTKAQYVTALCWDLEDFKA